MLRRCYRFVMRALPVAFREEFGEELLLAVEDRAREIHGRGTSAGRAFFWIREFAALLRNIAKLRWADWRGSQSGSNRSRVPRPSRWYSSGLLHDLGFAARSLRRSPGYSASAVLTVAVGIAANTSVFTLVHTVLFRPLPFSDPDRLLIVEATAPEQGDDRMLVSYAELLDWQRLNRSFSGLAGFLYGEFSVTDPHRPAIVMGAAVSADFLAVLGVEPILGRGFAPREESEGAPRVVLIGEGFWRQRFGGDPDVVGKSLSLAGEASTIVGVLPAQVTFPERSQVWIPFRWDPATPRFMREVKMLGRLAPGVTERQAMADLQGIAAGLASAHPDTNRGVGIRTTGIRDHLYGGDSRAVFILYGVVSLILLLACANVAILLLIRNDGRRQELAVRASLGMGRGRLVRLLLSESLVLAILGGVLGVVLGWKSRDSILALRPPDLEPLAFPEVRPDVLLAMAGIVLVTGIVVGLVPALSTRQSDLEAVTRCRDSRRDTSSRLRFALVAGDIALALAVVVGANLLLKSAAVHRSLQPGFDARQVATLRVHLPDGIWTNRVGRKVFYEEVLARIRALPQVRRASIVTQLPSIDESERSSIHAEGAAAVEPGALPRVLAQVCDGEFFATMGIPLLAGRSFGSHDEEDDSPRVAIVNEAMARRSWAGEPAVGKRIAIRTTSLENGASYEVVGVVGDTYNRGWGLPAEPEVYFPIGKMTPWDSYLVAKADSGFPARSLLQDMRRMILGVSDDVPISQSLTMESVMAETHWELRFYSWTFSALATIALLLAATGVYGITAHLVSQRRREIALRIAVGAPTAAVRGMLFLESVRVLATGLLCGLIIALPAGKVVEGVLFRVMPTDLTVLLASMGTISLVVILASYLPLRCIDPAFPMRFLREE